MFIIYNLGILCIEYLQVHIHTQTHLVRVQFRIRVFVSERLVLCDLVCIGADPLVSSIIGKSMFSHVHSAAFSS